ncbi:hypothetical protein NJB1604_18700 [Mycobacterium marinum]|uniref:hypothetical protein n=1 Tax=Mycobacterium marinum TaxID=1781 RepID=UPI0021C431B6|nr:hypothetical protein [Mycobacterium marinum]GJO43302.1 hypothetical protein NJB1604_18700 [Mycobacterium marinum]
MSKLTRCERCGKRLRNPRGSTADSWGIRLISPIGPAAVICPDCLTTNEWVEMQVRGATSVPCGLGTLAPKT